MSEPLEFFYDYVSSYSYLANSQEFRMNTRFPQNTLGALRLALVAAEQGAFEPLHQMLFDAMWVQDRDLSDPSVLSELAATAGLDAEACMAAVADPAIKDALKTNTEEAVRRGAFGAPTFFLGKQMFFGNDRLDFITRALQADA